MKNKSLFRWLWMCICWYLCMQMATGQDSLTVEGYTYETNNRGFIRAVQVQVWLGDSLVTTAAPSDKSGRFTLRLPIMPQNYRLLAQKAAFYDKSVALSWTLPLKNPAVYVKIEMERLPGYMLEASVTEFIGTNGSAAAYAVEGALIEVYNNTLQREELRLVAHPKHAFSVFLEQGNEYIFMIRKEGYYTKRLRANINVNGCILCMEGFGTVTPGVVENLTQNNTKGLLVTTIPLKKMVLNETFQVQNIYYDLGKSALRPEAIPALDNLAEILKDNPNITIELSSHTDCRGSNEKNQSLSQSRAEAVVAYIVKRVPLSRRRIIAKGYGETRPVNSCIDGATCTEEMHQQNRRTEFTVTEIQKGGDSEGYGERTLAAIMQEENLERQLAAIEKTYVEEVQPIKPVQTTTIQPPQAIPFQYTGFKIEVSRQKANPDLDDPIFKAFAPVYLDVMTDGTIVFLVGDYSSKALAEKEQSKWRGQYPKSMVVEYVQGVRK